VKNGNFFSHAESLGLCTRERVVSGRCSTLLKITLILFPTRICSYMMKGRDICVMAKGTPCPLARIKTPAYPPSPRLFTDLVGMGTVLARLRTDNLGLKSWQRDLSLLCNRQSG